MSLLSSLFKSKKVNLTPNITPQMPSDINPQAYGDLSKLSHNYINGVGTGFGEDFVNKVTNPVAQSMRRNYQNVTAPTISSNYSSRGLGNSSLAANAQGLAEGNVESDIGNLMAQFYNLNEAQKKSDTQFGAQLGQNILSNDVIAQHDMANQSERLANATAVDARAREANDRGLAGNILQAGSQLIMPMSGALSSIGAGMGGNVGNFLSQIGNSGQQFGNQMNNQSLAQQFYNLFGTKANIV